MALLQICSHLFIKYMSCINLNIRSIGKCFQRKLTNPNVYILYCTYHYFHKLFVFFVERLLNLISSANSKIWTKEKRMIEEFKRNSWRLHNDS